jgi:uncharacterized lipoprotein
MYKFILAVAVISLSACGSAAKTEETVADSTAVAAPVADSAVATDSSVVAAPTTGTEVK